MKEFLTKSLILVFGLGVAMSFTACHSEGSDAQEQSADVSVKHSISGTILKADGTPLTGATVKINNSTVTVSGVSGNAFSKKGLADGNYVIEIACANYKSITETVALQVKNIDGKQAAQNLEKVYYLSENVTTTVPSISGTAQTGDDITLATTQHKYADGNNNANTTDEEISVHAETPMVTGDPTDPTSEIGDVEKQIKDQIAELEKAGKSTDGVTGVSDFKITLTNITSLEDAKAVAVANHVATSRMTRATTAMPDGNELLAGVAVNAGPYAVTLPAGKPFVVKVKIPDEVKGAITLFRYLTGDSWTKIPMDVPSPAEDIEGIDIETPGYIIIKLKTVQTQSFGFGVIVNETSAEPQYEDIYATPLESGSVARTVPSMPYQAKSGVVMTQATQSALTDFLRKIVIRKYGTRIVKEAKLEDKSYIFDPVYTMHANGTLYLQGWQAVKVTNFSVKNSTASFTATEYGDIFVAPYEVWTEPEEPVVHGGGSN